MRLAVFRGDGIGPEIVDATLELVHELDRIFDLGLELREHPVGLAALADLGSTFPQESQAAAADAHGVLLGPLSTSDYPPVQDGGVNASAFLRQTLDLYANIRPSRSRRGVAAANPVLDVVIVRENTEGFYAVRTMHAGSGEFSPEPGLALAIRKISAGASERIARAAFELARTREARRVTAVHKRNVLKLTDGVFVDACRRVADDYADVAYDEDLVDAVASKLVSPQPNYDVLVTTNLFGDILSNEAAALSGGLGLAGSLNCGDRHAMAQASHGSAPDLAGRGIANPVSLISSVAMLLRRLGERAGRATLVAAADCLDAAVDQTLSEGLDMTPDLGGSATTLEVSRHIRKRLRPGRKGQRCG